MKERDTAMNQDESKDWKAIVCHEYEIRKNLELQLAEANASLHECRQALKTSTNYTELLEGKLNTLQRENAQQNTKMQQTLELLKKAKSLISTRKQELTILKAENEQLKTSLSKQSDVLAEETLQHQTTATQLAETLEKLHNAQEIITADQEVGKIVDPDTSMQLEKYFLHKIVSSPMHEDLSDSSLSTDTEFIANLMFIEQHYFER